jgi:hypothetical protein
MPAVVLWHLGSVRKPEKSDYIDWDAGREGYIQSRPNYVPAVSAQKTAKKASGQNGLLSIRWEERVGSLIAAAGTIWAVYVATQDFNSLWRLRIMPPGPVEVCALGILAWLHAKWRHSLAK